jgi:NRAMP (natural resistance-associated macrophage protein)-like metal ion transporter
MDKMKKTFFRKAAEAPAELLEKTIEATEEIGHELESNEVLRKPRKYWETLGPGLTTGAADDDPSGIATYSQTGAQYGFGLLWLAAFTFPLMAVIQEMCARIGLVTGRGLATNIRMHFPRKVLYISTLLLFAANTFNIGADLGVMAKTLQLLNPNLNFVLLIIGVTVVLLCLQIFMPYNRYAKYLKYLSLVLFAYVASALLANLDWGNVLKHAVIPTFALGKDQILLICAILGTTISPYLFFWQTSQEVEDEISHGLTTILQRSGTNKEEVHKMRTDVWSGMFFSNLVMFFIIAACGAILFPHGITNITSAAQAAEALRPFAGDWTYFLFTIGILGTGMLAIPVLAGSSSYAISESFKWNEGLSKKLKSAYAFYGIIIISMIIGLCINFIGLNPIKVLIYSAVANGIVAPLVLLPIVIISGNKKIMGEWVNKPVTKVIGWIVIAIMAIAGIAAIISLF